MENNMSTVTPEQTTEKRNIDHLLLVSNIKRNLPPWWIIKSEYINEELTISITNPPIGERITVKPFAVITVDENNRCFLIKYEDEKYFERRNTEKALSIAKPNYPPLLI